MIDKVYVTCSKDYEDKWISQQAVSDLWGVPPSKLVRYPFKLENRQIPADICDIAQLMVDDGFEGYRWFYDQKEKFYESIEVTKQGTLPVELAKSWTLISLLREVVERGESAIVMTDSVYLYEYSFNQVNQWLSLSDINGIALSHPHNFRENPDLITELELEPTASADLWTNFSDNCGCGYVFSAEGAKVFLDAWLLYPQTLFPGLLPVYKTDNERPLPGFCISLLPITYPLKHRDSPLSMSSKVITYSKDRLSVPNIDKGA